MSRLASHSRPTIRRLRELLTALLLAGPLVVAGTLGGGYWLARKALAPVERMAAIASRDHVNEAGSAGDDPNPRDELGRLASTFNDMIARLQRSFDEIRRFTADAAHELRTPLASMRHGGRGRPARPSLARRRRARARGPARGDRAAHSPRRAVALPLPRGRQAPDRFEPSGPAGSRSSATSPITCRLWPERKS